ncbi:MAG TPA: transcription antitermination factor NusB [Pseudomonas sp.]|uniref:transcription antitermination factor NusB n=1 Tax=Pseudomonas sp. TaxID=306 RepID=UPI002BA8ABB2|nr:transcription antitermination factor NusB [Pseudomonas sp.]HTO17563.1 transcription antitermination factor NusB [Pseudomonas sp.]
MSLHHDDSQDTPQPAGKPTKGGARRAARALGMQALYQWHMARQAPHEIEAQFRVDNAFVGVDGAYFRELLNGVIDNRGEIDELIAPCLDRPLADLDPVELAILRLSTYELKQRIDVPYRVVINEGIELAKTFGATDGHKFVNGVLDKLAPKLRSAELRAGKR